MNSTDESKGQNPSHNYSYTKVHSIPMVSDYHTEYFDKASIAFKVFAYPYYKGKAEAKHLEGGKGDLDLNYNDPRLNEQQKEGIMERRQTVR